MGIRRSAAGRYHLGVFSAIANVDAAGTYSADDHLVLCFFPDGLFIYGRVMP